MEKCLMFVAACAIVLSICMVKIEACPVLIEDTYTVEKNDTLDSIVDMYIVKNTYGKREHREFKCGIQELNPWLLDHDISAGETLRINYWINSDSKKEEIKCQK